MSEWGAHSRREWLVCCAAGAGALAGCSSNDTNGSDPVDNEAMTDDQGESVNGPGDGTAAATTQPATTGSAPPEDFIPATGGTWLRPDVFRTTHDEFTGWDGPAYPVSTQWERETDPSSPVVADGTIYNTTMDQTCEAIDLAAGDQLWETTELDVTSTPFLFEERLFLESDDGISELDRDSGDVIWQPQDVTEWFISAQNGRFYYLDRPGSRDDPAPVSCYDLEQQTTIWTHSFETGYWGQIVGSDGTLYRSTRNADIRAYDPETGERRWTYTYELSDQYSIPPGVMRATANVLYVPLDGETERTLALDTTTGEPVYTYDGIATVPVVADGSAFIYDAFAEEMVILDVERGDVRRRWPVPHTMSHTFDVIGDSVYLHRSDDLRLFKFDGDTGDIEWDINPSPMIAPGQIVVLEDYLLYWTGSDSSRKTLYAMAP